jgi:hypothetical protein
LIVETRCAAKTLNTSITDARRALDSGIALDTLNPGLALNTGCAFNTSSTFNSGATLDALNPSDTLIAGWSGQSRLASNTKWTSKALCSREALGSLKSSWSLRELYFKPNFAKVLIMLENIKSTFHHFPWDGYVTERLDDNIPRDSGDEGKSQRNRVASEIVDQYVHGLHKITSALPLCYGCL